MRRLAAAIALGAAALVCTALAYAAIVPQTGQQGPRSATLTPGTAELLEDLGGSATLSGSFWSSTTGGATHAGYGSDFRSYHYHGEALDLRVDKSLWDVLYNAMGRADYGLVELFGPWGLYKNGIWLDPATHAKLWRGHQNHIHVSFTGTPDMARAIVGVQPPPPPPAPSSEPAQPVKLKPKRQLTVVKHPQPRLIKITPEAPRPLPATVRELSVVTLRPLASAASAVPQGVGIVYGSLGTVLLGLVVVLLVAGAAAAALSGRRESWLETRLAAHVAPPPMEQAVEKQGRRAVLTPLFAATERLVGNVDVYRKAARLLERADVPLRAVEFLYVSVGAALLCGTLGALFAGGFGFFLGMAIGAAGPWLFVRSKARRRSIAFENQLPDVLVTLASSLKSGHSFRQGLQAVADEEQPPISKELVRVLAEARLGRPIDEALADMTERVGSKDLDFLLAAITIQTQVGGSMAGLFDLVSDTIRERQQFARKINGLTATGRASAKVLIGLPVFLAFVLTLINRDYMSPLYHTSTGHVLLATSVFMTTIGALILRKMVSFRA